MAVAGALTVVGDAQIYEPVVGSGSISVASTGDLSVYDPVSGLASITDGGFLICPGAPPMWASSPSEPWRKPIWADWPLSARC